MKTVKQLAAELNVSKSTLHRLIQRNDFETIQQGNKRLISETIEKAIIQALQEKSLQGETIQNDSAPIQKRFKNDSETIHKSKSDSILIQELRAQIDGLKEDKAFLISEIAEKNKTIKQLNDNIAALTAEREAERKERQTILAELLSLRGQKRIEVKAEPRPQGAATKQEPKQKTKLSLMDRLRAAASDIFRK